MKILNLLLEVSIYSAVIFIFIMLFKQIFKEKISPMMNYGIWMLLVLRLMIPLTFESNFHMFNIPQAMLQEDSSKTAQNVDYSAVFSPIKNTAGTKTPIATRTEAPPVKEVVEQQANTAITSPAESILLLSLTDWLLIIWLVGIGVISLYFIGAYLRLHRCLKGSFTSCPKGLYDLLEQCRQEMGVRRKILISCHANLPTPALSFPNTILMPTELFKDMSNEQIKMVLRHELMHYKRKDHIASFLVMGLLVVYWFNPLVWIAYHKMRDDMETACDSMVVKKMSTNDKANYAHTLLSLFSNPKQSQMVLGMSLDGTGKIAEKRIRSIFMQNKSKFLVRLSALLLIPILLTACFTTACQPSAVSNPLEMTSNQLVLYISPSYLTSDSMFAALTDFRDEYPDVDVEVRTFGGPLNGMGSREDFQASLKDYQETLQRELTAGRGPDFVLWDSFFDTIDPYKAMESGAFDDLNHYIENDDTFNLADYNENVLNAGIYKGKRYLFPTSYAFPSMITTKEVLAAEGLSQDGNLSFTEYLTALKAFAEKHGTTPFEEQDLYFNSFLPWSGIEFIDNEKHRSIIDQIQGEELKSIVDTYKSYYVYDSSEHVVDVDSRATESYQNNLFTRPYYSSPTNHFVEYSLMSYENTSAVVSAMKSINSEMIARVETYASIRANSPNKANAYNFLKILLSEQNQTDDVEKGIYGFPVLKGVLQKRFEGFYHWSSSFGVIDANGNSIDFDSQHYAPIEAFDEYFDLVNQVDKAVFPRKQLSEWLFETMEPYLTGTKSYEQCLAEFESKVELYAGE